MSNVITTALGRVQPNYRGTYNSTEEYNKLDYVDDGIGSSYICKINGVINKAPADYPGYWQLVAARGSQGPRGFTGGFGTPSATASAVPYTATPNVSIEASGPDSAKIFNFSFDIPAGPTGFKYVTADASSLPAGSSATVVANLSGNPLEQTLSFVFGIPAADGEGVKKVDGLGPGADGDVSTLGAVSYIRDQTEGQYQISEGQRAIARNNIGALAEPSNKNYGQFLQYGGNVSDPSWVSTNILQVPTGGTPGYILRKQASAYGWTPVYETPAGGSNGSILMKGSDTDYDFTWSNPISNNDIDIMINE